MYQGEGAAGADKSVQAPACEGGTKVGTPGMHTQHQLTASTPSPRRSPFLEQAL